MNDLRELQASWGATFEAGIPVSFGNDDAAYQASQSGVALYDRTHWGCLEVSDSDRLQFLHNQSTNDFSSLKPGQGCDTVFVTSTARTLDLATAFVLDDRILLLLSPGVIQKIMTFLDRYIFFADKVKLTDVTDQTIVLSVIGAESHALLEKLGAGAIVGQPYASHQGVTIGGQAVRVAVGSGLATDGYTVIANRDNAAIWKTFVEAGAVPLGDRVWNQLRIAQGRPLPGQELTEEYNPLEAGLWHTISFSKGCYIGQETIARLDTYKGVKQQLWGIRLTAIAEPGSVITIGEEKVGTLTSIAPTEQGYVGLAYVRTKAGGAGLQVQVGDSAGELIDLPFVTRDRSDR